MKETIDIPEDLLQEVMNILNSKSKSETIIKALSKIKILNERQKIHKYKGKLNLDVDLDTLRSRNENFC
jgi:Arc/MetJ family transcription regulator